MKLNVKTKNNQMEFEVLEKEGNDTRMVKVIKGGVKLVSYMIIAQGLIGLAEKHYLKREG